MSFQDVEQAISERCQFPSNRLDFRQGDGAWDSVGDGSIESMDPCPCRRPLLRRWDWDALLEAGGDELDDVASGESDPFPGVLKCALIGPHFIGEDALWYAFPLGSLVSLSLAILYYRSSHWREQVLIVPPDPEEAGEHAHGTGEPAGRLNPTG